MALSLQHVSNEKVQLCETSKQSAICRVDLQLRHTHKVIPGLKITLTTGVSAHWSASHAISPLDSPTSPADSVSNDIKGITAALTFQVLV